MRDLIMEILKYGAEPLVMVLGVAYMKFHEADRDRKFWDRIMSGSDKK